jgi:hypothetical protein
VVLVDHAAETLSASHGRDDDGRVVVRRRLLSALVRAVIIEMVHVLADHREGVSFVVDEQPVGALLAEATSPPFDETTAPPSSTPSSAPSPADAGYPQPPPQRNHSPSRHQPVNGHHRRDPRQVPAHPRNIKKIVADNTK